MRILLIGGNGFIGPFVTAPLQSQGHSVAVFHRGTTSAPPGVLEILGDRNQLQSSSDELKQFAPDVVVDFVVSSGPQAEALMNVFRGIAGRIVLLSSIDVYRAIAVSQGKEDGPLEPVPLTEASPLRRTLHPYPPEVLRSLRTTFSWVTEDYDKIPAESTVMNDPGLPGTVLRLPMIYGPGDRLRRFYAIVKRVSDGRSHIIFADTLAQWKCPRGYVENVGAAIALAAADAGAAGRIYNVCEEPPFSELEWARKIADAMGWSGQFIVLPADRTPSHLLQPGKTAQHWSASSARIRSELGYKEPVALDDAIRKTIQWELEHPPAATPLARFDYEAEDAALAANLGQIGASKPS